MNAVLLAFLVGTLGGPLGGLAAALAGATVLERVSSQVGGAVLAAAGGFILTVAYLELLSRSIEGVEGWWALVPIVGLAVGGGLRYLIARVVGTPWHPQMGGEATYRQGQARKIAVSLAVVNVLEGLPIGVGFAAGLQLGFLLGAIMIFENFTEGLSISTELAQGERNVRQMLFLTTAPTVTLGLGGALGALLGTISPLVQAGLFGGAAGIMLYVVVDDIVYDAHQLGPGAITTLPLLVGAIVGLVIVMLA